MVYGNPEKGRKPVSEFINEINKYENYLETALAIEGMVKSRGSHASGVYIFNHPYTDINAMMKTPNDLEITQWDYHDSDDMGALKVDLLSIEALDKIRKTMDLLIKDGLMEWKGSLKETYFNTLHPDVLDYDKKLWEPTWDNKVLDLFQLDTQVGKQAMRNAKPKSVREAAALNSLMRLMATENGELPLDKYTRFKQNIQLWYEELSEYKVPQEEIQLLEKHYLPSSGVPNAQEELMVLLMDPKICGFTEMEANGARKIIGKKLMDKIPELKEKVFDKAVCSHNTIQYIWDTAVSVQMGYSFSVLHTTGYTLIALQELNLFNHYPSIYWNCGCLIVNSGDEEGSNTDYSKIAVALGNTIKHGINVELVDINESEASFTPNVDGNFISYGFRSLTGVGYDFIQKIIENRPFASLEDFIKKTEPNKVQATTLIKAGAFRKIDNEDRKITLLKYAKLITPKRKNLTIVQIPLLVEAGLIDPSEFGDAYRIYEFNRYVKAELRKTETKDIILDQRGIAFLDSIGKESLYEYKTFSRGADYIMDAKLWAKTYDKAIEPIRQWLKQNKDDLFESLRVYEMVQKFSEFGEGSIPAWEMEAMSFYYTEHELAHVDYKKYNISSFGKLSRSPIKEASGRWFRNKTCSIIGTVIGKNKVKGSIDLLTPEGDVVLVKMRKNEFSYWDKQVSERQPDGSKRVMEKSWFQRGNKLFLHGYRRDDQFIPKTYSDSLYPKIALIVKDSEGEFKLQSERV